MFRASNFLYIQNSLTKELGIPNLGVTYWRLHVISISKKNTCKRILVHESFITKKLLRFLIQFCEQEAVTVSELSFIVGN